jgi:hypothetical protein
MILILADSGDVHARHVTNLLRRRGREVVSISRADFGRRASVTFQPDTRRGVIALHDGTAIASDDVSTVWYRRPGAIRADRACHRRQQGDLRGAHRSEADRRW